MAELTHLIASCREIITVQIITAHCLPPFTLTRLIFSNSAQLQPRSTHHASHVSFLMALFPVVLSTSWAELMVEMVLLNVLALIRAVPHQWPTTTLCFGHHAACLCTYCSWSKNCPLGPLAFLSCAKCRKLSGFEPYPSIFDFLLCSSYCL